MLHYRLAIWQSAPGVRYITGGRTWSNDYPFVSTHESWFWHKAHGQRVASVLDDKLVMNLAQPDFRRYYAESLVAQVNAGDYDAVFADSALPDLLQWEAQAPPEPRLAGTCVRDTPFAELGGRTCIQARESFVAEIDAALATRGIPLLPNTGAFVTAWDTTRYDLTASVFVEGFADRRYPLADWQASTNRILDLVARDEIVVAQNGLVSTDDLAARRYYLVNYLLVKGRRTYLDYFKGTPLQWYPEWGLDLGPPLGAARTVEELWHGVLYRRESAKGIVLAEPAAMTVTMPPGPGLKRVELLGGGGILADGSAPGRLPFTPVTSITVPTAGGGILVK